MTHVDRAILDALDQGCTGKTRALAQAYRALRVARHYTPREDLAWTWAQMEREGRIEKRGRTWHVVESEVAP